MKNLVYLFACIVLFSCKEQKTEKTTAQPMVDSPKQWLTYEGKDEQAKHIVMISGDEEYRSEEALPQLAKILSKHHGFKCTVLFAQDPAKPGIVNANYGNNIPGLEALNSADMMVIFTRFRALPDEQMQHIDNYLKSGKPVMGLRTATHAFNFNKDSTSNYTHYGNYYKGELSEWTDGFGRLVLGENWVNHHGHHKHQSTRGIIAEASKSHPIVNGIENGAIWGSTDVYGVRLPFSGDTQPIVLGQVINREGEFDENDIFFGMKPTDSEIATTNDGGTKLNDPMIPVAWTKTYQIPDGKKGKAFTSTVSSSSDLLIEGTRRLLVNATFWAMDIDVPAMANVDLIGDYNPSQYEFRENAYWLEKEMKIEDLQ